MRKVCVAIIVGLALSGSNTASAQSDISGLAKQRDFSSADEAAVAAWVDSKAAAFGRARRPRDRVGIRDEIRKLAEDGATTQEFRELLARQCGRAFSGLVAAENFDLAHEAALVVLRLGASGTRDALMAALLSRHSAVRYQGAKGLMLLRDRLRRPNEYEPALDALAQAGASETDPIVLRMIYQAIDLGQAQSEFAGQDQAARALLTVFHARHAAFEAGARNEEADLPGFDAAGRVYAGVRDVGLRSQLVASMAEFLAHLADRYVELGPGGGGLGLLGVTEKCEEVLARMIEATEGAPPAPGNRVSARIKAKSDGAAVREALVAWIGAPGRPGVLNGAPWRLPIGLEG